MGTQRGRRNLGVAVAAIAVAAAAVVLVIVLSGDDESNPPASTLPGATSPAETGQEAKEKGGNAATGQGAEEKDQDAERGTTLTPAPGTPEQREREISPNIRQRVAGAGLETIRVRGGVPVGGLVRLVYEKGDRVQLRILADRVERFSIRPLGLSARGGPPRGAHFDFIAVESGLFGVELTRGGARTRVAVLVIR
jgi:hypothetical protein